jgi:hypothetical protein
MPSFVSRHSMPIPVGSVPLTQGTAVSASPRPRSVSFAPAHLTLPRLSAARQSVPDEAMLRVPMPAAQAEVAHGAEPPAESSSVPALSAPVSTDPVPEAEVKGEAVPKAEGEAEVAISLASVGQQFQALKQQVIDCKNTLAASLEQAEKANVYPAKRTYWQKWGALMAGAGTVALFTALTVTTGGVGPAVALAAASLMAVKSAADTRCAYKDLKNKQARLHNPSAPLPYAEQPLGADAIGNFVCHRMMAAAKARHDVVDTGAIKDKARKWSLVLNSALKVITFSAVGVTGMAMGKAVAIPMACIGMSLGAMAVAIKFDQDKKAMEAGYKRYDLAKMPLHFEKLCDHYLALSEQGQHMPADAAKTQQLVTSLSQAYLDLRDDLAHLRQAIGDKTQARANAQSESTRAAEHGGADAAFDAGVTAVRRTVENTVGKGLVALGGNAEAAASMVSATKTLYMTYRMLGRVEQRTEPLTRHADQILSLRERMQWMAV